jgi:hypothetical protein
MFKNAFRVRLFPQPFFVVCHVQALQNRALSQHPEIRCASSILRDKYIVFVRLCGCVLRSRHGLSIWATPDRIANTSLWRLQG